MLLFRARFWGATFTTFGPNLPFLAIFIIMTSDKFLRDMGPKWTLAGPKACPKQKHSGPLRCLGEVLLGPTLRYAKQAGRKA